MLFSSTQQNGFLIGREIFSAFNRKGVRFWRDAFSVFTDSFFYPDIFASPETVCTTDQMTWKLFFVTFFVKHISIEVTNQFLTRIHLTDKIKSTFRDQSKVELVTSPSHQHKKSKLFCQTACSTIVKCVGLQ